MSNLGPAGSRRSSMLPTPPTGTTIARYATYVEAQKAVDFLSDNQFPVKSVTIVGTDLRMVERVTGRLTYGRVALGGAASGAYFGLFVGLLLLIFAPEGQSFGVLFAMLIGAGFGMLFGVLSYSFTGGRRDFTSMSQIVASEYQVLCADDQVREALEVLGRLQAAGGPRGLGTGIGQGHTSSGNPYAPPQQSSTQQSSTQQPSTNDPWGPPPGTSRPADSPSGATAAGAATTQTQAPAQPDLPPEGLTYGEVMEQRRKERQEKEAQARRDRGEA